MAIEGAAVVRQGEVEAVWLPGLRLYIDGGARGNPGPAAIGIVVCDEDDRILEEYKEYVGKGTNNQAEYKALLRGLEIAGRRSRNRVTCISDSELLVLQMTGVYTVRNLGLRELFSRVKQEESVFVEVRYVHMPRMTGHLARADELVNEKLDELGF